MFGGKRRRVLGDVDDLRVCADEDDVEGHRRVRHPEAAGLFVLEDKQHAAAVIGKSLPLHHAPFPRRVGVGNFDVDRDGRIPVLNDCELSLPGEGDGLGRVSVCR